MESLAFARWGVTAHDGAIQGNPQVPAGFEVKHLESDLSVVVFLQSDRIRSCSSRTLKVQCVRFGGGGRHVAPACFYSSLEWTNHRHKALCALRYNLEVLVSQDYDT